MEAQSTYQILRSVAARYASGVDQRDKSLLLSAFARDAVLVLPRAKTGEVRELHGHSDIATIIDSIARYPQTYHVIGQARYEFGDTHCAGEIYCVAHHITPERDRDLVMYVRYLDSYEFEINSGTWLLGKRIVNVDWSQTTPPGQLVEGRV